MIEYPDYINYPSNNNEICFSEEKSQAVIDFLNHLQEKLDEAEKMRAVASFGTDEYNYACELYTRYYAELNAAIDVCEMFGYKVERDWYGHRNTYFFATQLDAMVQEDFLDEQ